MTEVNDMILNLLRKIDIFEIINLDSEYKPLLYKILPEIINRTITNLDNDVDKIEPLFRDLTIKLLENNQLDLAVEIFKEIDKTDNDSHNIYYDVFIKVYKSKILWTFENVLKLDQMNENLNGRKFVDWNDLWDVISQDTNGFQCDNNLEILKFLMNAALNTNSVHLLEIIYKMKDPIKYDMQDIGNNLDRHLKRVKLNVMKNKLISTWSKTQNTYDDDLIKDMDKAVNILKRLNF